MDIESPASSPEPDEVAALAAIAVYLDREAASGDQSGLRQGDGWLRAGRLAELRATSTHMRERRRRNRWR
jgi:hypothetical protein